MTELTVNGVATRVEADDDTPLLTVLRDQLGLVGARFGCGQGLCGACVVLVGGQAMPSCQTPLWQAVQAGDVTTVEGLSADGVPHPVQQALLERQAAQCGFCLSGIVMRVVGLTRTVPRPTTEQLTEALEPHLCRCGVHGRILAALGATP